MPDKPAPGWIGAAARDAKRGKETIGRRQNDRAPDHPECQGFPLATQSILLARVLFCLRARHTNTRKTIPLLLFVKKNRLKRSITLR
jgi:hypothetical protein